MISALSFARGDRAVFELLGGDDFVAELVGADDAVGDLRVRHRAVGQLRRAHGAVAELRAGHGAAGESGADRAAGRACRRSPPRARSCRWSRACLRSFLAVTAPRLELVGADAVARQAGGDGDAAEGDEERQSGDHVRIGESVAKTGIMWSPFGYRRSIRGLARCPCDRAYFLQHGAGRFDLAQRRVRRPGRRRRSTCSATGCTTGPASSRASAATRPSAARRSSGTRDHLDRLAKSAELYYLQLPFSTEEIAEATRELIRRNGLAPATSARSPSAATADGPLRADSPMEVIDRRLALGRLPRRRGQAQRHPRQGLELAPDLPGRPDPARQGLGPVPELDPRQDRVEERRLRGGDPARRARLRLRGLGREHLPRPRRRDRHPAARRLDPRRDQPQVGDPDRPRPRLHGRRARHRPRRALPGRGDLPHRHRRRAGAGARDRRPPDRRAGRDHPRSCRRSSKTRCTAAPRSTSSGSTPVEVPAGADGPSKVSS